MSSEPPSPDQQNDVQSDDQEFKTRHELRQERRMQRRMEKEEQHSAVPVHWQQVQSSLWLLGLMFLAMTGDWWPGILGLIALSGLVQAGLMYYYSRKKEEQQTAQVQEQKTQAAQQADQQLQEERASWLPATCPQCGAPISVDKVDWTGRNTAVCPYCDANLKPPA